jgi:hypothetical protein
MPRVTAGHDIEYRRLLYGLLYADTEKAGYYWVTGL